MGPDPGMGPDLEMGPDLGMGPDKGSDLGTGAVKRRAGDSNVAASAAMFEPFSGCKTKRQMHVNQHPVLDRFCTRIRADMAQMGPSSDSRSLR